MQADHPYQCDFRGSESGCCDHPHGPYRCADADIFPADCPLEEVKAARLPIGGLPHHRTGPNVGHLTASGDGA
jgi:hypothetical protein